MSENHKNFLHLRAGAIAGLVSCVLLQPLDVIKTRQQQLPTEKMISTASHFRKIIVHEGSRGLWRGLTPSLLRSIPGNSLYFGTLGKLKSCLKARGLTDPIYSFYSGIISRSFAGFVLMPFVVAKTRFESTLFYNYKSLFHAFSNIWKHEGLRGFYYGYVPTFLRDVPYAGVYLFLYETCKKNIKIESQVINNSISAIISGFLSTVFTQPFDVIRVRIQLRKSDYKNTPTAFIKILRESGVKGFFAGIGPRLLKKTLGSFITWTVYEEFIKRRLG